MAKSGAVIGKVVVLQGHAYIRAADGTQVELKLGDPVHEGDVIVTGPGAVVELGFAEGQTYVVPQNETVTLDASVFAVDASDPQHAALASHGADLKAISDAIANGGSLDQLLDAPAAGLGGGDANSGHSFVQLFRIVEGTPTESTVNNGSETSTQGSQLNAGTTGFSFPSATDTSASEMVAAAHQQPVTIHLSGTDATTSIVSFTIIGLPTNGTLYLADGKTPVYAGEVIGATGNSANVVFVAAAGITAETATFNYSATDAIGTVSNVATATIHVTPAPTITIDPLNTINGAEAASTALIAVTGTVSGNVPVGDTVTLTVGGQTYTGTVQSGETYSIGVPGNVLASASVNSIHASVTITDTYGDVGSGNADQAYTVELTAPPITIGINPIATVNGAEAASSAPIDITGTVSSNVPVGDTVTLTVDGHTYTGIVQTGGTYSIGIPGSVLAAAGSDSIVASVSMTDPAGNVANASATLTYAVELTAPPISISINPIATVNGAEAASSALIDVTGTVSSNVPIGDTVTVTVDGHSYTGTVQAGGTYSIGVPGDILAASVNDDIVAHVSMTDAAGNVASASATLSYSVELVAPAIAISIDPIALVTSAVAQGSVSISGVVSSNDGGPIVGDTVTLSVGGHTYTGTVQAGGAYTIVVPGSVLADASSDSVHASVSGTDAAGNVATASTNEAYSVDLTGEPIAVSINAIGTINAAEGASSAPIAITGTVSSTAGGPIAGDTVTLTVGGNHYTGTVQANGTYSIDVPGTVLAGAATDTVQVSVSGIDSNGNVSTASASANYNVSTLAPDTPTVSITTDTNHDGVISATELNGASTVTATVTLDSAGQTVLTNGGSVQISVVDAGTTTNLNLHLSGSNLVDAGGNTYAYSGGVITLSEAAPGNGNTISVTATETDVNHNVSSQGTASAVEQTVAESITITVNPIGVINGAEGSSTNPVAITGTVSNNVPVGDSVTLTLDGH
ncbi:MAG: retention module-containing protein, partial [Burkholderiaceae bacterium]|nr:retention module-containing protein [Burkholderiaceae bacterium]